MIEQQGTQLLISFPTEQAAASFKGYLETLLALTALLQTPNPNAAPDPASDVSSGQRSQHTVLTDDRLEALFNQRQQGQTAHQRVLRAQTTLRDGVLPFSKPGEMPAPSGQPSPRQKAAQEGGFADGATGPGSVAGHPAAGKSRLRPAFPQPSKS